MGNNICAKLGVKEGTTISSDLVEQLWSKYSKNDQMSESKIRSFLNDLSRACNVELTDNTVDRILYKCAVTPEERTAAKRMFSLRQFKKIIGISMAKVPIDLSQSLRLQIDTIKDEDQLIYDEYCVSKRQELWAREEAMSVEERRGRYKCSKEKLRIVEDIPTWEQYAEGELRFQVWRSDKDIKNELLVIKKGFEPNPAFNKIVSLWRGDITKLEIGAIQNAAKESLLGGGGIDGAIHSAAGEELVEECELLQGCATGDTKTTRGYNLPAKFVLHTVGPVGEKEKLLRSCYKTTLDQAKLHNIRSVALCGVSTGIFGYPLEKACPVALQSVREWLSDPSNAASMDKIVFTVFLEKELECYELFMPIVFPLGFTSQELSSRLPSWALDPRTGRPFAESSAA